MGFSFHASLSWKSILHPPGSRIAAAAFLGLGLEGSVELGTLDQVMDVSAYRRFNR